jgi:hypothetical protein
MKFTIRDLFLVTLIVALAVGWWVERRQLRREVDGLSLKLTGQSTELELLRNLERMRRPFLPNPSAPAPNPPKK